MIERLRGHDVLGYALVARDRALVIAGAIDDEGRIESVWSADSDHVLVLPSRVAALTLAVAIDAGPDVEIRTVVAERRRMTKAQIKQRAAEMADALASESGDPAAAREAWIDVGGNNAGWVRRGVAKAKMRKGVRKGGSK